MHAPTLALFARRPRLAALALAAPLLAGCERVSFAPSLPYAEYRDAYEQAICEWRERCSQVESVDACRDTLFIDRDDHYYDAAIEAGTIKYHGDKAFACIEEMADLGCQVGDGIGTQATSCLGVFEGMVPPEAECLTADECAYDGVCGFDPSCTDMCCMGHCRILPGPIALGDACGTGVAQCEEGTYCGTDPVTFQPTVCTERIAIGQPCQNNGECVADAYCAYDLNTYEPTICTALAAEGERCDQAACAAGLTCAYVSDLDNHCVKAADLGEPCEPNAGQGACTHVAATCNATTRVCEIRGDAGAPCNSDYQCIAYTFCEWTSQTCVALAGLGEACGYMPISDYEGIYIPCAGELRCGDANICVVADYPMDACTPPDLPEATK